MSDEEQVFLIVDDEPDMCLALENILKRNGFVSQRALDGRQALTLVRQIRFRLAFLDAKLPDIEGLELAKRIQEVDPSVRIVIVSGYFYRDDVGVQRALAEGLISGFIAKPFDHHEIIKTLESTCSF